MDILTLDSGNLTKKVSEGIYYFDKTPFYYVILFEEYGEEFVFVYDIHDQKAEKPTRRYRVVGINKVEKSIPGGTYISDTIKSRIPKDIKYKTEYYPPLFRTVVTTHIDSVTGHHGKGFFEHKRDKEVFSEGKKTVVSGKPTGIFITLENIKWVKEIVPIDSMVEEYRRMKEEIRYE